MLVCLVTERAGGALYKEREKRVHPDIRSPTVHSGLQYTVDIHPAYISDADRERKVTPTRPSVVYFRVLVELQIWRAVRSQQNVQGAVSL